MALVEEEEGAAALGARASFRGTRLSGAWGRASRRRREAKPVGLSHPHPSSDDLLPHPPTRPLALPDPLPPTPGWTVLHTIRTAPFDSSATEYSHGRPSSRRQRVRRPAPPSPARLLLLARQCPSASRTRPSGRPRPAVPPRTAGEEARQRAVPQARRAPRTTSRTPSSVCAAASASPRRRQALASRLATRMATRSTAAQVRPPCRPVLPPTRFSVTVSGGWKRREKGQRPRDSAVPLSRTRRRHTTGLKLTTPLPCFCPSSSSS